MGVGQAAKKPVSLSLKGSGLHMKKARFFESIQKKDFFKPAIWANTYKHILLCHNRMQEEDSKYCIFEDEFSDIEVDEHILKILAHLYIKFHGNPRIVNLEMDSCTY